MLTALLIVMDVRQKNKLQHTGPELRLLSPASTFSMSANFVAPSASAIRMTLPLELNVPFKRNKHESQHHSVHFSFLLQSNIVCKKHPQSHHPHSASFPPVLHQRQHPHFICTVLPSVLHSNLATHHRKMFTYKLNRYLNHFKMKS